MRWLPERLPFNYRLLLAFTVPLLIWVFVSAACIFALHVAQDRFRMVAEGKATIARASEYRNIIEEIRDAERAYLLTSMEHYLRKHREAMRRANSLHDELAWRVRGNEAQLERLEDAGEILQKWFYDQSSRRTEARRDLPYEGMRSAQVLQQQLLALLLAETASADVAVPGGTLARARTALESLRQHATEGRGAIIVEQVLDDLDRYETALDSDPAAAERALRDAADTVLPSLNNIMDAEYGIYSRVIDPRGPALAAEFNESMGGFISAEQALVENVLDQAQFANAFIEWTIWAGLIVGIILMAIVIVWFVRRLGNSIRSIDEAAEELSKGNFEARAIAHGSANKLAEHFNTMASYIQKRHEQTKLLASLGETLHNCRSINEALTVFGEFAGTLFPEFGGVLYLVENNRIDVTAVASWHSGEKFSADHMVMDDCWGLRLNRLHENGAGGTVQCGHLQEQVDSLCVPLPAFGKIIGMIFIQLDPDASRDSERERQRQFVDTVAEQVALALANVKLREELKNQAIRDPLTQLYNRRQLDETLDRELHRADRHQDTLAVLALDIDNFKRFNDTHGHDGGDMVLRGIGETMRDFFRPEDGLFRSGGEEFIAFLPGTCKEDALARADELRTTIATMNMAAGNVQLPNITISIGVAVYPADAENGEQLLKAADIALYEAKKRGRNRVVAAG